MTRRPTRWRVIAATVAVVLAAGAFLVVRARQPQASVEAYCREIVAAEGLDESLASLDPGQLAPDVKALRRTASVAPPEVSPHVETVLDLTEVLQDTLESTPADQAEALEEVLRERAGELAAVAEAGRGVEEYTRSTCGVELNSQARPSS